MSDPLELSLLEVAAAIRERRVTSVEVTRACIERAEACQPRINAFISLDRDNALAAARAADAALERGDAVGPLHGVPLAHKDMFYRRGRTATCGSIIRRNFVPDVTATVLQRLDAAGALDLGGLNMSEFAAGPTGHNEHYGHCRNPWNPEHVSGGSSSGSGAATAARIIYGALGSDTGGSVRLPAAACGVVGLKPTYGRISRHGAMPRAWSMDTMGPLARTVADCALLTRIVAGPDALDVTASAAEVPDYVAALGRGVKGWKVGVPARYFRDRVSEEVGAALDASLDVLRAAGAVVVEVPVPDIEPLYALGDTLSKSEAATIHRRWMRTMPERYGGHTFTRVEAGFHLPATRYIEALSLRGVHLQRFVDTVFGEVDVLHAPVMDTPPPTVAATDHEGPGSVPDMVAAMTRLTRPVNYLGLPALSVPCGASVDGLPLAFQLIGRPFAEESLFRVAAAYERETGGWRRAPPLA